MKCEKCGGTEKTPKGACRICYNAKANSWYHQNKERVLAAAKVRHANKQANDPEYREKRRLRNVERRKSHPDEHRTYILKKRYGISPEQYDELLELQKGLCALCGKPPTNGHKLHVDHCHDTMKVRGLLHFSCNYALGRLGDNEASLLHALAYVRRVI